ncbi:SpoIIE family protein phosphatase [Streptomyces sp. NPDC095817]|uniref:ATP-binding SpoIIE family protein phosphatase n=1 Tax=Streptomyces sp. NPDC095817 TaxID=3155082 RepID=UPI003326FCC2
MSDPGELPPGLVAAATDVPLSASTAVVVVDAGEVVRGWDAGAEKIFGYSDTEVLGQRLSDVITILTRVGDAAESSYPDAGIDSEPWEGRLAISGKEGRRLDVEMKVLPISLPGVVATRVILASDATQAWWSTTRRSFLEGLTFTAPVGMAALDNDLNFTWVNSAMEELCGVPRENFLGQSPTNVLPGLDGTVTLAEIRQVLETGIPSTGHHYFGSVPADPGRVAYSTSCFRLETDSGKPLGVCYMVMSTTDHYRAVKRLKLLNDAFKSMGNQLDVEGAGQELADAVYPELADHVTVDLLEAVVQGEDSKLHAAESDRITTVRLRCVGHRSIRREVSPPVSLGDSFVFPTSAPTARSLVSGVPALISEIEPTDAEWAAADPLRSAYQRAVGIHSLIIVPIRSRDVTLGVVTIGRSEATGSFDTDDLVLLEELVAHAAVCIDNARRYVHERNAALTLQRSLLPFGLPEQNAVEAACRYLPADIESGIGGDWFDVLPLSGTRVALVTGDVVGHGIHAAAAMGRLRAAVQTLADIDLAPDEVLAHLDDMVSRIADEAADASHVIGASCLYAVYDPICGQYTLARAGHPAPVLITADGHAQLVDLPSGPPLGHGGLPFEATSIAGPEGSILALYTKGLLHAPLGDGDIGHQRLIEALAFPEASLDELCDTAVADLAANRSGEDAVLLLARASTLPEENVARWEVPKNPAAVATARSKATQQLAEWGLDDLTFTTELIVSELVTNAIRYGTEPIALRLIRDRKLICEVFDGSNTSPHLRHARTTDEGGRGLFLIAQLAERWGTRYVRNGKTVWSEQALTTRQEDAP